MKHLKIVRDRWLRGIGPSNSSLLTQEGKMCCLGFCLKDIYGVQEEKLLNKATPACVGVFEGLSDFAFFGKQQVSPICSDLMAINDIMCLSIFEREKLLIDIFRLIGGLR